MAQTRLGDHEGAVASYAGRLHLTHFRPLDSVYGQNGFAPTEVIGLPGTGAVGETYTFQIVGDLTITDVTRPVTFDAVATATSEAQIEGTATTAFPYTDFELFIPDAPALDPVDDEVRLELDFVAEAVQ